MKGEKEIQDYFIHKRDLYSLLLAFIDNEDQNDKEFHDLVVDIKKQIFEGNKDEIENFLILLVSISNHHHRVNGFFERIEKILFYFSKEIKETFTNLYLFSIFQRNKRILLFLLEKEIITLDPYIIDFLLQKHCQYFLPELKKFKESGRINEIKEDRIAKIDSELSQYDSIVNHNFDKNRHRGENSSYICTIIQKDSIEDFISYISKTNISFSSQIQPSLFETNSFLIDKTPTIIEYVTFQGSIQIFNYLLSNKVELTKSLWIYAIHSNNTEIIQILLDNNIEANNEECLIESIKCHHNDIKNYFESDVLGEKIDGNYYYTKKYNDFCFEFYNYSTMQIDLKQQDIFYILCLYNHHTAVNILLKANQEEIETTVKILKKKIFFYKISKFLLNAIP